jgi:hypothetical protein
MDVATRFVYWGERTYRGVLDDDPGQAASMAVALIPNTLRVRPAEEVEFSDSPRARATVRDGDAKLSLRDPLLRVREGTRGLFANILSTANVRTPSFGDYFHCSGNRLCTNARHGVEVFETGIDMDWKFQSCG